MIMNIILPFFLNSKTWTTNLFIIITNCYQYAFYSVQTHFVFWLFQAALSWMEPTQKTQTIAFPGSASTMSQVMEQVSKYTQLIRVYNEWLRWISDIYEGKFNVEL